jgi:hypothetical protein
MLKELINKWIFFKIKQFSNYSTYSLFEWCRRNPDVSYKRDSSRYEKLIEGSNKSLEWWRYEC